MKRYSWIFVLAFLVVACGDKDNDCANAPSVASESSEVNIERLDRELFNLQSPEEILKFLNRYPGMKQEFLGSALYPSDSILAIELYKRIMNPYLDTLYTNTEAYFGDMDLLRGEFAQAFAYLKHYYPNFQAPRIQAMVTGFGSSEMYVSDSLIVIGLDFYLGPQGKYRPPDIPGYILERYQQAYIVPATMLLYADSHIKEDRKDNTMLADMIYYGKKYEFAKQMMPCTPDSLIVWYSGDKLANVEENKDLLWFHFVNNELLFETNHLEKQKYMDERPFVPEIGDQCPGRIGAWIGWDMLRSYKQEFPDKTLQEILEQPNAQALFNASKYRGGI